MVEQMCMIVSAESAVSSKQPHSPTVNFYKFCNAA